MTEPKPEADKFREFARELEWDKNEAAFDKKVRKLMTAPKSASEPNPPAS